MKRPLSINEQSLIVGGVQGMVQNTFSAEGYRILLQSRPVDLEPRFRPYTGEALTKGMQEIGLLPKPFYIRPGGLCFIRLWFPTQTQNNKARWQDVDFLRELTTAKNPIYFLILGNKAAITHILAVDIDDLLPVENTLKAKFPDMECELTLNPFRKFGKALQHISKEEYGFDLRDYYTGPAYWRTLIIDEGMKYSPLLSIYSTLSSLKEDEIGFYQVIFKPVVYPWSKNMLNLIDTEIEILKYGKINLSSWYYPGFGNKENRNKVNSPILAVVMRTGVFCREVKIEGVLNSLSLALNNFQFGGDKLNYLCKEDYKGIINNDAELLKMLATGIVYHSGNLFNTKETTTFLHFPDNEILKNETYRVDRLKGFRVPERLTGKGVTLGYNDFADRNVIVKQPEEIRPNHMAIEGLISQGKSCLIENMSLDDIRRGQGVGILDPHGDTIEEIITRIPKERIKDTIYFDPCDEKFALYYNPCQLGEGEDIGKRTDDLTISVRSLYSAKDWGSVIESVLTPVFYTLLKGKDLALADARVLLSKTKEGYRLRESVLPFIGNPEVKMFWTDLFERMPASVLHRVLNKLSKFLLQEKVYRIFSQQKNKINFRKIIDEKKIFLGYIPAGKLGSDCANILGSTIVSAFHNAGMSRQNMPPSKRVPFNFYVDECQRFALKSFEDSLRELRKYNVRLILAYQQREQLPESIKCALGNIGTMIVLGLDWDNAQRAFKEFFGKVEPSDFMRRNTGDGFAKIGNDIISIKTFPPEKIEGGFKKEIIQHSREHYYTKVKKNKHKGIPGYIKKKVVYDEI